jgi:hypothetical protein
MSGNDGGEDIAEGAVLDDGDADGKGEDMLGSGLEDADGGAERGHGFMEAVGFGDRGKGGSVRLVHVQEGMACGVGEDQGGPVGLDLEDALGFVVEAREVALLEEAGLPEGFEGAEGAGDFAVEGVGQFVCGLFETSFGGGAFGLGELAHHDDREDQ